MMIVAVPFAKSINADPNSKRQQRRHSPAFRPSRADIRRQNLLDVKYRGYFSMQFRMSYMSTVIGGLAQNLLFGRVKSSDPSILVCSNRVQANAIRASIANRRSTNMAILDANNDPPVYPAKPMAA